MARKQHVLITPVDDAPPRRALLIVALVLTGLSMRVAVSSVGSVLDDVQDGLHTTSAGVGLLTTLPVLVFAGLGVRTPALATYPVSVHGQAVAVTMAG